MFFGDVWARDNISLYEFIKELEHLKVIGFEPTTEKLNPIYNRAL